jgi:hypothetical protein
MKNYIQKIQKNFYIFRWLCLLPVFPIILLIVLIGHLCDLLSWLIREIGDSIVEAFSIPFEIMIKWARK